MITQLQILIILLMIACGYYVFWKMASNTTNRWSFKNFFLGGANIGADLTENNTVGITFAWSGGTWFFTYLAYHFGPWVILSQPFWCVSIVAIAILLPVILPRIKNRTIHGFLREYYGVNTQRVAAVATTIGYFINGGFEIYWSSRMFSECLGRPDLDLPIAIVLSCVVATYCSIGGYKANARIDKLENLLGVASLAGLVCFVSEKITISPTFSDAVLIFAIISAAYCLLSVVNYIPFLAGRIEKLQNAYCVLIGLLALGVVFLLIPSGKSPASPAIINHPVPWSMIVNTISFQIFFNAVDMQNWQELAANGDAPLQKYRDLQWAIVRGSLYLLWFPALGGILLGCLLHSLGDQFEDHSLFANAFQLVLPNGNEVFRGALLGLLFLGFLATSLSTAGDLLMSATQTIAYDIVWPERINRLIESQDLAKQNKLVRSIRRFMPAFAVLMVIGFFALYKEFNGPVFDFQGVMYSIPLSLLTPVYFALFRPKAAHGRALAGTLSITLSIVITTLMFVSTLLPGVDGGRKDWTLALTPVVSNAVSLVTFFVVSRATRGNLKSI